MTAMRQWQQLYDFLFKFDENVMENLWTTKGMEGARGRGGCFL
jgi:hypothetical protein